MRLKKFNFLLLVIVTGVALGAYLWGAKAQDDKPTPQLAPLKDSSFINLDWSQWKGKEAKSLESFCPPEKPNHAEGVFYVKEPQVDFHNSLPLDMSFYSQGTQLRVLKGRAKPLTEQEEQQIALKFLNQHFAWFFEMGTPAMSYSTRANDNWTFTWKQWDDEEFETAFALVEVRSLDAKIVSFTVLKVVNPKRQHKIKPRQAKHTAIEIGSKDQSIGNIQVVSTFIDSSGENPQYVLRLQGQNQTTQQRMAGFINIDAITGKPEQKVVAWRGLEEENAFGTHSASRYSPLRPNDKQPVWIRNRLLFTSIRTLSNMPDRTDVPDQLMSRSKDGVIHYLTRLATYSKFAKNRILFSPKSHFEAVFGDFLPQSGVFIFKILNSTVNRA